MHNTMIYGNSADQRGIIYMYIYRYISYRAFTLLLDLQLEMHNTTIHSNRAGQGGALSVYNEQSHSYGNLLFQLAIHNITAYSNRGGAVYIYIPNR